MKVTTTQADRDGIQKWSATGANGWGYPHKDGFRVVVSGINGAWREITVPNCGSLSQAVKRSADHLGLPDVVGDGADTIYGTLAMA